MALIVQKYGGTSVANLDRIKAVAARVKTTYEEGNQVVVVVSARGGVTNELIARAKVLHSMPDERELDMLTAIGEQETIALTAIALHALGVPAISQTGAQAGILTDPAFTRARIQDLNCDKIQKFLEKGKVVIVAGFQGVTADGEITTLGRGGSDLTAIALAHGLQADACQIYTDVDGIYTADPRIVLEARKISEIAYDELLELTSMGFKVMQSRAVEFAQRYGVAFEVRSSFNNQPGTLVKSSVSTSEKIYIAGVALDKNQTCLTVEKLSDKPGIAAQLFQSLGEADIVVDMIVQNVGQDGVAVINFTVNSDDALRAQEAVEQALCKIQCGVLKEMHSIAKISIVGVGMCLHTDVAAVFFKALSEGKINIQMISTSEIKISATIHSSQAEEAVRLVHHAFKLETQPIFIENKS